jgi:hypothetical protein
MVEITSANDIELVIERGSQTATNQDDAAMGRMVVDDFSLTNETGSDHVPSVGNSTAAGIYDGVTTFSFSWTMMGSDVDTFEIVTNDDGSSTRFSFTARKVNDDGSVEWEKALTTCTATNVEDSASAGDAAEYAVEGIGVGYDRQT